MIHNLKQHYKNLLETHGASVEAVQHINKESQYKRFEILTSIDANITSIIDIGCGLGDMYSYLLEHNYQGEYLGLDFVEGFIELANEKFKEYPKAKFQVFDINCQDIPKSYDYIIISGVFNNKTEDSERFLYASLDKMFAASKKGIAFNAMSTYVDFYNDELYYSNPLEVFDYCKKHLTSYAVLKHDYIVKKDSIPYEYTMFLYKSQTEED